MSRFLPKVKHFLLSRLHASEKNWQGDDLSYLYNMSEISALRVFERAFPDRLLLEKKENWRIEDIIVSIYALYDGNKRGTTNALGYAIVIENGVRVQGSEEILIERGQSSCEYYEEISRAYDEYEKLRSARQNPHQLINEKRESYNRLSPEEKAKCDKNEEAIRAEYGDDADTILNI